MSDRGFENLRVECDPDGIALVTVDRPTALNALNDAAIADLDRCFENLERDPAVRVVILTGAGPKAFVAGADIKELAAQSVLEARDRAARGQRAFDRIEALGKPVLAAINGFALGGGCELALACHLRFAATSAQLGLPEVGLGIIPGYGGTQRLPRLIGQAAALRLILTGERVTAEQALELGLVNAVFAPEQLLDSVRAVARVLLSRGPVALRLALNAVIQGGQLPLRDGLALEADSFGLVSSTADMREGMQAFLEKRPPSFTGR
ncbi:MAG: enoyl-CoA hydratase-related protein [Planctomycetota bacterium]